MKNCVYIFVGRTNSSEHDHDTDSAAGEASPQPFTKDEEPQPNSRSAIFRHRGITQAKKNKYWNEKVERVSFKISTYVSIICRSNKK